MNGNTQLENIKYKNMLLSSNKSIFSESSNKLEADTKKESQIKTLDDFLESDMTHHKDRKSWSRLSKIEKIEKIDNYVDAISPEYELSNEDNDDLKIYLRKCLSKKMLQRVKDVVYDKDDGAIKKINGLHFRDVKTDEDSDKTNKKKEEPRFVLKHTDRKESTLKNLGSGKSKKSKILKRSKKKTHSDKTTKKNIL